MLKTAILSFAALFFVCLLSCGSSTTKSNKVKEFEGIIIYKAEYIEPNDTTHYNDTIKCYYSHGNILKVHLKANPGKIRKDLYIAQENKRYGLFSFTDSVYCFNVSVKTDIDVKYNLAPSNESILSHNCEKFSASATHMRNGLPYHTVVDYTFSKGYLPIDKDLFTDCNYDSFNEYTNQCGVFYLAYNFTATAPDGKIAMGMHYQAVSVEEKKLDPTLFEIDKSKLIKMRQP